MSAGATDQFLLQVLLCISAISLVVSATARYMAIPDRAIPGRRRAVLQLLVRGGGLFGAGLTCLLGSSVAGADEDVSGMQAVTVTVRTLDVALSDRIARFVDQLRVGDPDVVQFYAGSHEDDDVTERFQTWWHGRDQWQKYIFHGWDLFFISVGIYSEKTGDFAVQLVSLDGDKGVSRGDHGFFLLKYRPLREDAFERINIPQEQYFLVQRNPASHAYPGWRIVGWAPRREIAQDWLRSDSPALDACWSVVHESVSTPSAGRWHYRDLDSGKWFYRTQTPVEANWLKAHGVDIEVGSPASHPRKHGHHWAILCDTAFAPVATAANLTAAGVRQATADLPARTAMIEPGTYVFRTRERGTGILIFEVGAKNKDRMRWLMLNDPQAAAGEKRPGGATGQGK